jgi:tetratricopeptide (TPR) repeat protein
LVQVDDGFQLWSETFDRTLDDIFVIQDEIAKAVVDELKINLLGAMPEGRTTDPKVYSLYLQGKYFNNLRGEDNLEKAVAAFKQALASDPDYAPAWVGIQLSYSLQVRYAQRPKEETLALAMEAIERALAIDENMASAWAALAFLKRTYEWDWEGARVAINKALKLEPNNAEVLPVAASLAGTFGRLSESVELFERSVELDPLSLSTLTALGNRYVAVGRYEDARALYERVLALNPEYPGTRVQIARTYLDEGRPEEALAELPGLPDGAMFRAIKASALFDMGETQKAQIALDDFLESPSKDSPLFIALLYASRGENDEAFEWLEMAREQRIPALSYMLIFPVLARLKDDPRYPIFLEKMGLREAWEAMPAEYGGPSK